MAVGSREGILGRFDREEQGEECGDGEGDGDGDVLRERLDIFFGLLYGVVMLLVVDDGEVFGRL